MNGNLVRGMKDSGCQTNFISVEMANRLGPKVIRDNVILTVKGINIPKSYETKLMEGTLDFNGISHVIRAMCLPSIDISLNLPNLSKVVDGFLSKGYKLADEILINCSDTISNIDIILGSKSGSCIPETEITFGETNQSMYSKTPHGVLLKGDMDMLVKDIQYLPYASVISNTFHAEINIDAPEHPIPEETMFFGI